MLLLKWPLGTKANELHGIDYEIGNMLLFIYYLTETKIAIRPKIKFSTLYPIILVTI